MELNEKLKTFIASNIETSECSYLEEDSPVFVDAIEYQAPLMKMSSISTFIEKQNNEFKFQKLLFEYIDKTGKKDSDIYNRALIDRRLFSKIRSDENYHPSKETVISLGLALELSIENFEKLLNSASYSLPKNNVFDLIIRFCIIERIYDINEINILLDEYKCNLLAN